MIHTYTKKTKRKMGEPHKKLLEMIRALKTNFYFIFYFYQLQHEGAGMTSTKPVT